MGRPARAKAFLSPVPGPVATPSPAGPVLAVAGSAMICRRPHGTSTMAESNTTENEANHECDDCGNTFHADQDSAGPFTCPNCKSDNASPLNG